MKGKKLLATIAVSAVLFTGCGLKSAQTIIKVNDTKISQAQFDEVFDREAQSGMMAKLGVDLKNGKNDFMYNLIKTRVVNELVIKAMLDQEMDKRNIKVNNDDMEEAMKSIVDKVGSKEQLDKILKENGVKASDFKKDLKEQVRMKKLAESLGNYDVSDADVKAFYNRNIDKFKYPEKVRASHILIAVNPQEMTEVVKSDPKNANLSEAEVKAKVNQEIAAKEAKAKKLFAEAKKDPSSFAKLAKENSEDPTSAEKGGELGFFAANEMVPEFSKASFGAKPNTVVGPVKTQFGYHIIYVKDRMAAGQEPFEKVKTSIKDFLTNQKQLEQIDKLVESLKKNAKIEYVNKEYDPEYIQQKVQESIQKSGETAKQLKKEAEAKKQAAAQEKK